MIAPDFWSAPKPTMAARALAPLGALYGALTARRMARPGRRVGVPVVCVGNFVVGGAGKTPTAIALARLLQDLGERVAFLSRGYGGAARAAPLLVDPAVHSAAQVGDEALLLARVAPCTVGPDRVSAARRAIEAGASVLVLDDGLQNPGIAKDFTLAVIDGGAGFGNGLCFPAGPLRAPIERQTPLVKALVLVDGAAQAERQAAALQPAKPLLLARLEPDREIAARLRGQGVLAFAGIGRPAKFFASLEALGARLGATQSFADHHAYEPIEIEALLAKAAALHLTPVTTQKDHVRLAPAYAKQIVAVPVDLRFDDPGRVEALLSDALARRRAQA